MSDSYKLANEICQSIGKFTSVDIKPFIDSLLIKYNIKQRDLNRYNLRSRIGAMDGCISCDKSITCGFSTTCISSVMIEYYSKFQQIVGPLEVSSTQICDNYKQSNKYEIYRVDRDNPPYVEYMTAIHKIERYEGSFSGGWLLLAEDGRNLKSVDDRQEWIRKVK